MKKMFLTFIMIIITLSFWACDENRIFEKNKKIPESGWNKLEMIRFEVPIQNTIIRYNFYINIGNTTDYKFSNLFLFIKTIYPDRNISRDTVECTLSDKNGLWLGNGMGSLKNNNILFRKGFLFPKSGLYSFEFEQAMRVDVLKGISNIGLRIEKLK